MKKKHLRMFRHMFAGLSCLMVPFSFQAQVTNPETWSAFVESDANPSVIDTFRWQLFTQAEGNNWKYIPESGAVVSEDQQGLKMPLSSSVVFEEYSLSCYKDVSMIIGITVHSLVPDDTLYVVYSNEKGEKRNSFLYPYSTAPDKSHYTRRLNYNPYYLELSMSEPAASSKNGYLQIDSVYSYGTIRQYSLFLGQGNWNDTLRWSHLPPMRHRNALVSGIVEIDSAVQCKQVLLGKGSLHVAEKGHLIVDELVLYRTDYPQATADRALTIADRALTNTDRALTSTDRALTIADRALTSTDNLLTVAGKLSVNKQLSVRYTFPEKGKWYFLSFPFDVCLKGIDKRFQLKDNTFSGQGDFLYVQVYDGDKRALNKKATGNWTVLPSPTSTNDLVFEKGKGYLVALDAAASDNMLSFSVESDRIPDDFGKTSTIPVHASSMSDADEVHTGWYLCGNPLPAPLSLSRIVANPALDGYIYVYDGSDYKSYPVGSKYVLPPFSAFFVKASGDTQMNLTDDLFPENAISLETGHALRATGTEPLQTAVHNSSLPDTSIRSYVKGKTLYLENIPSSGTACVSDFSGRVVYDRSVPPGSSVVSLPLPAGFYIINIVTDSYRTQHKCVLTQ